jgi:predicted ATP-binding protein involved in virulence
LRRVIAMILNSIRVEKFKCIEDSGEFSINPVTCLVGKNESGKTALLQALYKLNPDIPEEGKFDPLLEYPRRKWSEYKERHETNPDNVLTTVWELDEADIEALAQELGTETLKNTAITVTKGYDDERYWDIEIDEQQVVAHYLKSAELDQEELASLEESETIAELIANLEAIESQSERQSALLSTLQNSFSHGDPTQVAINVLEDHLPTFLYFGDYYKLAGEVSINDLRKREAENRLEPAHRVFISLLDLVGTSSEDIDRVGRFEELIAELEAVSNRLSQETFEYWSQNKHLEVEFHFDHARPQDPPPLNEGYIFRTRIKNRRHGVTVGFDERSAGFVWFFSFLIWFSQVKRNYGENLFILLDDPALSLHARAQADLLRYINERLKPHHQVIYTTHSPFMIDPENILSVRTVEDVVVDENIQGTKVGDEVFSTDRDTLFPLQAALGYDITQTLFVGKHTLLVEGPSDLLYLKWFSRELQEQEMEREYLDRRWVITPSGGVDKIGSFLALFGGAKLHVAVLTDFHTGQKRKVRNLKESDLLKAGHVLSAEMYVDQDEADVEDLLGRSFYTTLVNKCYSLDEPHSLPIERPSDAPIRVLKEVENHFATLPPDVPEFDHYKPASFLMENTAELRTALPDLDQALDKFEKVFKDLNALLAD